MLIDKNMKRKRQQEESRQKIERQRQCAFLFFLTLFLSRRRDKKGNEKIDAKKYTQLTKKYQSVILHWG